MKLFRFGAQGEEKPGIIDNNGRYLDASGWKEDFGEIFFGSNGMERFSAWIEKNRDNLPEVPEGVRIGAPITRPGKIVCIGLNYRDHAEESGSKLPAEPVVFMKAPSAWSGPFDGITIPRASEKTDYEVELAVVIGRKASYVSETEAEQYIAGYALFNDVSERDFQTERAGQWVKGKSADSFAPMGPYLVTKDELGDVHNLGMWLKVNGEMRQNSNTGKLIFKVPYLVSYISQFMSLLPGDVISTGTPAGVAAGRGLDAYLKPGDLVEYGIDGLGTAAQRVSASVE